jgi:aminoglycoside phosphotransferase (APT) family kinase protein
MKTKPPKLKTGETFFSTWRLRQEGVDEHWPEWMPFSMTTLANEFGDDFQIVRYVEGGVVAKLLPKKRRSSKTK